MTHIRIAIVGDFDRGKHSHWATEAALFHVAARVGVSVEPRWVPTPTVASDDGVRRLREFDGVWGAPGSPYASMDGILRAVQYAREHDLVYLGTCAGFQYALIEFTRNVLGLADADTAENGPRAENTVITPVSCAVPPIGSPKLAGGGVVRPVPGTLLELLCGSGDLVEEYFCNFETNPDFISRWEAAGLCAAARGSDGEMRAFQVRDKRFFVATLFQPQLSSSYERPHAIIEGYLRSCTKARGVTQRGAGS